MVVKGWLMAAQSEEHSKRFYAFSLLYAIPGLALFDNVTTATLLLYILCALHLQVRFSSG
jgi:Na+/H+ antiporter NhaD/arsenite permease-like protein